MEPGAQGGPRGGSRDGPDASSLVRERPSDEPAPCSEVLIITLS